MAVECARGMVCKNAEARYIRSWKSNLVVLQYFHSKPLVILSRLFAFRDLVLSILPFQGCITLSFTPNYDRIIMRYNYF